MQSNIAKWGNSLAVRLPVECLRVAGLKEGAEVELAVTPAGEIRIVPVKPFDKRTFLKRLEKLRKSMPMTEPVVGKLRAEARY